MDNIILSITTSDKKSNDTNFTEKINIVSCNVYKPITGLPDQKELMDILKKKNKAIAIDINLPSLSSKEFVQKFCTTDQESCFMMV